MGGSAELLCAISLRGMMSLSGRARMGSAVEWEQCDCRDQESALAGFAVACAANKFSAAGRDTGYYSVVENGPAQADRV